MPLYSPFNQVKKEQINTTSKIVDTSYCPECNSKMPILQANEVPTYVCLKHRISLPVPEVTK